MKNFKLKIGDIENKGCMFSLQPIAQKYGVNVWLLVAIMDAGYAKAEIDSLNRFGVSLFLNDTVVSFPDFPTRYSANELSVGRCQSPSALEEAGLIYQAKGNTYQLTEVALTILLEARETLHSRV